MFFIDGHVIDFAAMIAMIVMIAMIAVVCGHILKHLKKVSDKKKC